MRFVLAATAAVGVLVLSAGLASGHKERYKSKVTIGGFEGGKGPGAQDTFFGKVKAGDGCEKRRKVTLYYWSDEVTSKKEADRWGSDKTNKRGKWSLEAPAAEGFYRAQVSKRVRKNDRHRHVCRRDWSKTFEVSYDVPPPD